MDGDVSNVGAGFDRPNATGTPTPLSPGSRNVFQWFNTGAYVQQPDYTFGNVGRNTVIGPGFVEWDFSTLKDFHIMESKFLQFRFEAFNSARACSPEYPHPPRPARIDLQSAFHRCR